MNTDRILEALKRMIVQDDTQQYLDAEDGEFSLEEEDAFYLEVLQEAQRAYYEATGDVIANSMGVVLVQGKTLDDAVEV